MLLRVMIVLELGYDTFISEKKGKMSVRNDFKIQIILKNMNPFCAGNKSYAYANR